MLKPFTEHLKGGRDLSKPQVIEACTFLFDENHDAVDKADFLVALHEKGETAEELVWFALVALDKAVQYPVPDPFLRDNMLDVCGTGGGGLNIFNVSTCLMFILAAAGIPVAKHGNRGVTKKSGSADVLEALGIKIDLSPEDSVRCMQEVGCTFLMAPHYHPAFKAVAPVRKMLAQRGQRTVFNLLGPLVNPFKPAYQMVGLFDENLLPIYSKALKLMGRKNYLAVCGKTRMGKSLGELSIDARSHMWGMINGEVFEATTDSGMKFDINTCMVDGAEESAKLIERILSDPWNKEIASAVWLVLNNASVAAWIAGNVSCLEEAELKVQTALYENKALELLRKWQSWH